MKAIITLFIVLISNYAICQDLQFNLQGEAQYTLEKKGISADTLFNKVHNYIKNQYAKNSPCIISIDSLNYKIKIEETIYDVLYRQSYSGRNPKVDSYYRMEISLTNSKINFKFKHLRFQTSNLEYYLSCENLISEATDPMIYSLEKKFFTDNFMGIIKTYDYYIDNKIVKLFSGADLEEPGYWDGNVNFDKNGESQEIYLRFSEITEQNIYDRISSFIQKYYYKADVVYDLDNKKITVNGGIFDVFYYRIYIPNERFISEKYEMKIFITDNVVKLKFKHKEFRQDGEIYTAVSLKDILNAKESKMLECRQSFLKAYNRYVSSLKYYIDTLEMKTQ